MKTHPALSYNLANFTESVQNQIKAHKDWLWHLLPILAKQPLVFNNGQVDIKATMEIIAKSVYEHEGYEIPGSKILYLWQFIAQTSRSELLSVSQNKNSSLSSGVPIVLYAYKHQHNVLYNAWRSDPLVSAVLGKDLAWLPDYKDFDHGYTTPYINSFRRGALTELKLGGKTAPDSSNKLNRVAGREIVVNDDTAKEFDALPRLLRYMILQTWIWHPSIRSPNMITDWTDWDAVMPPYNNSVVVTTAEKIAKIEDSVFGGAAW